MAVDFSFPEWMVRQHTFAGALARGAQVGQAIANARYRNQALAAQAVQSEREYALRERQLDSQQRTADLSFQLQSQLVKDQSEDKAAITGWIQERNKLPMEERLSMKWPALKLAQSYEIINKVADNDRMVYERSVLGQSAAARAKIFGAVPELAEDYFHATDPIEKREILRQAREQYVKQQPASIAAESRVLMMQDKLDQMMAMEGIKQENRLELEGLRNELNMLRDQFKPLSSGSDRFDLPYSKQLEYEARLKAINEDLKYLRDPKGRDDAIKALTKEYEPHRIDRRSGASTPPKSSGATRIRDKATGKEFLYRGNAADIPADKYEVLP